MSRGPFWRVVWAVNQRPAADLYTNASALARRMAQAISDIHGAQMELVDLLPTSSATTRYAPRRNPTLVHHGKANAARWHVVGYDRRQGKQHALADLYIADLTTAKNIGQELANLTRWQVQVLDNRGLRPALSQHKIRGVVEPARRNPSPSPLPGQTWRRRGGGSVRVTSVGNGSVVVTDLSSGNRDRFDRLDFIATHTLAGTRPNPKRKGRKPYGIGHGRSMGPSALTIALDLGYPFPRGEGKATRAGAWLSRFTKKMDGTGGAVFVGFDHKTGRTVIEHENPRRRGGPPMPRRQRRAAASGRFTKARHHARASVARGVRRLDLQRRASFGVGRNPRGGPRIVYNKLLGGWYVVTGPHQTPLNGRFNSKAEAQAWLSGRRANPKGRKLSVPEQHQLRIARQTLTMTDAGARIMGGPTKEEAREIIRRLTGREPVENPAGDAFKVGQRVQLHAATSEWMQGDRYGVVVGFGRARDYRDSFSGGIVKAKPVRVKLDKSGRVRRFHPDNLFPIEDNPHRTAQGWEGWTTGERFRLAMPIRTEGLTLDRGELGTLTLVSGGSAYAVFDSHPLHHPVPVSPRWLEPEHGVSSRTGKPYKRPKTNPKGLEKTYRTEKRFRAALARFTTSGELVDWFATDHGWVIRLRRIVPGYTSRGARLLQSVTARHGSAVDWDKIAPPKPTGNPRKSTRGVMANFNRFSFTMPIEAAQDMSGPGPADEAVQHWAGRIVRPAAVTPALLAAELKEYGAWDAEQLSDDDENWRRILWIAAGNILEGNPRRKSRVKRPNPLPRWVDPRSIRTVGRGATRIRVGCPKGKWSPSRRRCSVGTRMVETAGVRGKARRNPRESEVALARRTFRRLNQIEPGTARVVRGARNAPKVAVQLGELVSFVYRSDKYAGSKDNPHGKELLYEHKTKRPRPVLATDPSGREVHIVGGRMHPTPDGLVN
jgi:hypothetical protein